MTDDQIRSVTNGYLETYAHATCLPKRDQEATTDLGRVQHALWMCQQIAEFLDEGKRDKAFRWLGFIQGVLWSCGEETIEAMKGHNRG